MFIIGKIIAISSAKHFLIDDVNWYSMYSTNRRGYHLGKLKQSSKLNKNKLYCIKHNHHPPTKKPIVIHVVWNLLNRQILYTFNFLCVWGGNWTVIKINRKLKVITYIRPFKTLGRRVKHPTNALIYMG